MGTISDRRTKWFQSAGRKLQAEGRLGAIRNKGTDREGRKD